MKAYRLVLAALLMLMLMSCKEATPDSKENAQSANAPSTKMTGGEIQVDEYPTPINRPSPEYPKSAMESHTEGTVWLNVVVSESGTAKSVSVAKSSGSTELDNAALGAAKQWTFKPAQKAGKPVELLVTIPFRFKLSDDAKE